MQSLPLSSCRWGSRLGFRFGEVGGGVAGMQVVHAMKTVRRLY
jgi:hypothetical protein